MRCVVWGAQESHEAGIRSWGRLFPLCRDPKRGQARPSAVLQTTFPTDISICLVGLAFPKYLAEASFLSLCLCLS